MANNPLYRARSEHLLTFATAGTATNASSFVDMQGADGVYVLGRFGTAATQNTVQLLQATATGQAGTALGSTLQRNVTEYRIDAYRPSQRYVKVETVRAASSTLGDVWAIKYNIRRQSSTATSQTGSAFHSTPT